MNPEIMGRTEPQVMTSQPDMPPAMGDIRMRFEQLQSEFIEDPPRTVQEAERLLDDLCNRMRERIQTIHRDIAQNGDTEHLRLAMRGYREMIESLGTSHAA